MVEELSSDLVGNVAVDQLVPLEVLMDAVEGVPVPSSQEKAAPVFRVLLEDSLHAVQFVLEMGHLPGCGVDLSKSPLSLLPQVFVHNLN